MQGFQALNQLRGWEELEKTKAFNELLRNQLPHLFIVTFFIRNLKYLD